MRLLTHNTLKCPAKDIVNGFPMLLEVDEIEVVETDCNHEFIKHLLPSLSWPGLLIAAEAVKLVGMPAEYQTTLLEDNDFLEAVHKLLIDIHVLSGHLICPDTGRRFPITDGVPCML